MTDIRKRLMIKLPKFKYGFVQDIIMKEIANSDEHRDIFSHYIVKVYSIAKIAIHKFRIAKKKALNYVQQYDYFG